MNIKYLGHSAFEIETSNGKKILIDPFLVAAPNYKPQNISDIFVTHAHGDHLGEAIEIAKEKDALNGANRQFTIIMTETLSFDELWNIFCTRFRSYTTYDNLVSYTTLYEAKIKETIPEATEEEIHPQTQEAKKIPLKPIEKLDVNNCSEIELTALPGINIVMAKKLIKKREEIGGFKKIDDVFLFLHLKEHMINQLRFLICVNKMKGSLNLKRFSERQVDL